MYIFILYFSSKETEKRKMCRICESFASSIHFLPSLEEKCIFLFLAGRERFALTTS